MESVGRGLDKSGWIRWVRFDVGKRLSAKNLWFL